MSDTSERMYDGIRWTHRIRLPNGVVTPGTWDAYIERYGLDRVDCRDKRVLDIGTLDGQYSFYAEQQGAAEVVSTDVQEYYHGYLYAHRALQSRAKYFFPMSVYELHPQVIGEFDVVYCLGVFYHLLHPALALERINSVLRPQGIMVFETEVSNTNNQFYHKLSRKVPLPQPTEESPNSLSRSRLSKWLRSASVVAKLPYMIKTKSAADVRTMLADTWPALFLNEDEYHHDRTNFWIMNRQTVERQLDATGFEIMEQLPFHRRVSYLCRKVNEINPYFSAVRSLSEKRAPVTNMDIPWPPTPRT
jgi:2-polyprenyl-3-methyl-5-hydroxy-6-metoxy-1,4-benzoquinol methylase